MSENSDEEIVKQIQEGEVLLFETLVRRYQKRLLYFTKRLVGDEKNAEEIVQDTFLKTYLSMGRIDPKRRFSTFIFEVTKNTAFSFLRKKKLEMPLSDENLINEQETNMEKLEKETEKRSVQGALSKLPEHYQKAVRLYYFQDLSYEEISRKLRVPINTVRTHLRRAKAQLKGILLNKI